MTYFSKIAPFVRNGTYERTAILMLQTWYIYRIIELHVNMIVSCLLIANDHNCIRGPLRNI